jgi:hypothetical protein
MCYARRMRGLHYLGASLVSTLIIAVAASAGGCAESGGNKTNDPSGGSAPMGGMGGDGGSGAFGGDGGAPQGGAGPGGAPGCAPLDGPVLALDAIFLGDKPLIGSPSATAWQGFGFDIDGQVTTSDFSNHCLPNSGANPSTAFADAPNGNDNAFGKNVLPILLGLNPSLPDQANLTIAAGGFTLIAFFEALSSADMDPLTTYIWGGAPLGSAPAWNGSDCWLSRNEDVADPMNLLSATTRFDASSLSADVWSSNGTTTLVVPIDVLGYAAPLTILHARMRMQLAPSHLGAALGHIGGVVDTEAFAQVVRDVAGFLDPTLCSGATIDSLMDQIRQASDVMNDGTQDPTQVCNGISLGLGFTMLQSGIEGVAAASPPPADPCP